MVFIGWVDGQKAAFQVSRVGNLVHVDVTGSLGAVQAQLLPLDAWGFALEVLLHSAPDLEKFEALRKVLADWAVVADDNLSDGHGARRSP
jgi:hypothetical protein